jgi:hypothetical protein
MYYLLPPDRAFDVLAPLVVYRVIGRRPSEVYVTDEMTPSAQPGRGHNRLSDLVYWQTTAAVGDQIQERRGTTLLVDESGKGSPILLSAPIPLTPDTAFVHAQLAADSNKETATHLLATGVLRDAAARRVKADALRVPERLFPAGHALIVEEKPDDLPEAPADQRRLRPSRRYR